MPEAFSVGVLAGYAVLQVAARVSSAVSDEARIVQLSASALIESAEKSFALFGAKVAALSKLRDLAYECAEYGWDGYQARPISQIAQITAKHLIQVLPDRLPLPEFAAEPDGAISLDWIQGSNRLFSLSVGETTRLAYAWLDGSDKGHGVAHFDGESVPLRVLDGIKAILSNGNASLRTA